MTRKEENMKNKAFRIWRPREVKGGDGSRKNIKLCQAQI